MTKVQVFNPEMGTKKYVGQLEGFVSCNGFVLAVVVNENREFKCEKLTDILKISESENQDERNNERNNGGVESQPTGTNNPEPNGRTSPEVKRRSRFL